MNRRDILKRAAALPFLAALSEALHANQHSEILDPWERFKASYIIGGVNGVYEENGRLCFMDDSAWRIMERAQRIEARTPVEVAAKLAMREIVEPRTDFEIGIDWASGKDLSGYRDVFGRIIPNADKLALARQLAVATGLSLAGLAQRVSV